MVALRAVDSVEVKQNQPRLDALYSVMRGLRVGMPRTEVLAAIKSNRSSMDLEQVAENGDITLWVHYGAIDSCGLTIGFNEGRLAGARLRGEDGPHERCPSAPLDLPASVQ